MSRINKANLGNTLAAAISSHEGFVRPDVFDSRVYSVLSTEVDETSGCIRMRLALTAAASAGRIEIHNLFFLFCFSAPSFNSLSFWHLKN